ncbi:hypothetical protein ECZU18_24350 [Escherichia coli]|nr:hypothetical protein ECZU18_24350 [Escherichia coli]
MIVSNNDNKNNNFGFLCNRVNMIKTNKLLRVPVIIIVTNESNKNKIKNKVCFPFDTIIYKQE